MTIKTPPKDWDRHAQLVARSIAGLDVSRLSGKKTQFTAIIHEALVDAMMMAAESNTPRAADVAALSQTSAPVEQGAADKPKPGKLQSALAEVGDVREAVAEFRRNQRTTYPHEAVVMLLDALEQLVAIVETRVRDAQVSEVA